MSGLRRALIAERAFGKEQAQQWLYREPVTNFPQANLAAWRKACYDDAVLEHEHDGNAARLLLEWEAAFDSSINDVRDMAEFSITRAFVRKDIWTCGGFEGPGFLLARAGDVVVCQPSFIDQQPLTLHPRTGPIFCGGPDDVQIFQKVTFPQAEEYANEGERNA